jgi:tRNA(His) 5'-end guanylyltransferase
MKYNIQDCIVLYKVLNIFFQLILDKFHWNLYVNPTLSSLAFSLYRSSYIPKELQLERKIKKANKEYTIFDSKIQILSKEVDYFIRFSYFGRHVDAYITHFDNTLPPFEGKVIKQYLYPTSMINNYFPVEYVGTYIGDITQTSHWEEKLSFCQCRVIAPDIKNPIIPFRDKERVIYGYGTWEGTYFSE